MTLKDEYHSGKAATNEIFCPPRKHPSKTPVCEHITYSRVVLHKFILLYFGQSDDQNTHQKLTDGVVKMPNVK